MGCRSGSGERSIGGSEAVAIDLLVVRVDVY